MLAFGAEKETGCRRKVTMAGGVLPGGGVVKDYPGKMTAYVIFTCFIGATGGLIFGYDLGVSGIKKKDFCLFCYISF